MLDNCATAKEFWGGVDKLIDGWLAERQDVIVKFCAISGLRLQSNGTPSTLQRLKRFCQVLVDYTSAGHFEVYVQLMREAEDVRQEDRELAHRLYAQIAETTEVILDFNDTYDTDEHCEQAMGRLSQQLSQLGEVLVERFDLEDRLIACTHFAHQEKVA